MYQTIYQFWVDAGFPIPAEIAAYGISLVIIALVTFLLWLLGRGILVKAAQIFVRRNTRGWSRVLLERRVFHKAANSIIPAVLSAFSESMPGGGGILTKAAGVSSVIVFLLLSHTLIGAAEEIYQRHEISKTRPIKSLLQVVDIVLIVIGGIVAISALIGENPAVLLGGIGAMTAVTSLIFKDAILGFVAGIQLTANDMLRIGDWIEMPGQSADGTVIELSMTTVKVENFNKTITSIPAYTLVTQAFVNWRGMERSGGRRIKRAIYIEAATVSFCSEEMLLRLRKFDLLREYLEEKAEEIREYNRLHHATDASSPEAVNGRRLTNLGTFRAYIAAYLKKHPGIHREMSSMVRQLDPGERGIPLELYTFTNTVVWAEYESIQSDIFDHLYAIVPEFGLRVYQHPSGHDIRLLRPVDPV